ncbi:UNVERIFIED_CONTAM: hypothetical protein K2H54_070370 [Gekko kuhli]
MVCKQKSGGGGNWPAREVQLTKSQSQSASQLPKHGIEMNHIDLTAVPKRSISCYINLEQAEWCSQERIVYVRVQEKAFLKATWGSGADMSSICETDTTYSLYFKLII